jgi:hypothetical protein
MLTIGAGFGLMSLSVIIADCVMLHCTKNKSLYQKIKELDIKDDEIPMDDIDEEEEEDGGEGAEVERNDGADQANVTAETQN